ncbi:hypothetical protein SLEP1_g55311 [Rubroshorea leprosula]|uniref:Uncharacterized protein n=1 Tax=Rubroshorea leprosula TaxID=152421 RepID=A0AAV5MIU6_9ROSI|nr:hypothetical protein SLEP1_g55311 [Rubroshorea leprosula]
MRQSNRVIELQQTVDSLKADNYNFRQEISNVLADNASLREQQSIFTT